MGCFLGILTLACGRCRLSGGVSLVELLFLYELWAGDRLVLEKAVLQYRGPGRPISVSAVQCGPGTDIWRSCRFIGALFRALSALPGGVGRFVLCIVGANHCRHIRSEKCHFQTWGISLGGLHGVATASLLAPSTTKFGQNTKTLKLAKVGLAKVGLGKVAHDRHTHA